MVEEEYLDTLAKAKIIRKEKNKKQKRKISPRLKIKLEDEEIRERLKNTERLKQEEKLRENSKVCVYCGNRSIIAKDGKNYCRKCGAIYGSI